MNDVTWKSHLSRCSSGVGMRSSICTNKVSIVPKLDRTTQTTKTQNIPYFWDMRTETKGPSAIARDTVIPKYPVPSALRSAGIMVCTAADTTVLLSPNVAPWSRRMTMSTTMLSTGMYAAPSATNAIMDASARRFRPTKSMYFPASIRAKTAPRMNELLAKPATA